MEKGIEELLDKSIDDRIDRINKLANNFRIINDKWLCEYALRLSSAPFTLKSWAKDGLVKGTEELQNIPILVRASRFLVLTIHHNSQSLPLNSKLLYSNWNW